MHIKDPKNRAFEDALKEVAVYKWGSRPMLTGPIRMTVLFKLSKPEKGKKGSKMEHPAVTPDLDNLVKAVSDALNKIVFNDDAQVCELSAKKIYVLEKPGIDLWIEEYKEKKECHLNSVV